jgi:hypothetical protein
MADDPQRLKPGTDYLTPEGGWKQSREMTDTIANKFEKLLADMDSRFEGRLDQIDKNALTSARQIERAFGSPDDDRDMGWIGTKFDQFSSRLEYLNNNTRETLSNQAALYQQWQSSRIEADKARDAYQQHRDDLDDERYEELTAAHVDIGARQAVIEDTIGSVRTEAKTIAKHSKIIADNSDDVVQAKYGLAALGELAGDEKARSLIVRICSPYMGPLWKHAAKPLLAWALGVATIWATIEWNRFHPTKTLQEIHAVVTKQQDAPKPAEDHSAGK